MSSICRAAERCPPGRVDHPARGNDRPLGVCADPDAQGHFAGYQIATRYRNG